MAAKLSVGATVNEAFNFGLKRLGAVFGAFFLPTVLGMLILSATAFALVDYQKAQEVTPRTLDELTSVLRLPLPAFVALVILASLPMMIFWSGGAATIFRLVALGEERRGLFQLRLDGPAWRVFFAYLIQTLIGYGVLVVAGLVAWAVAGQSPLAGVKAYVDFIMSVAAQGPAARPSPEAIEALAPQMRGLGMMFLLAAIPSIYIGVKLAPFPAASAAEDRLALFKTFRMTFGAWWSMFWSWVLFGVAFILLSIVVALGEGVFGLIEQFLKNQGGAMAAIGAGIGVVLALFRLLFQLFAAGVQLAMPAIMYRRIETGA